MVYRSKSSIEMNMKWNIFWKKIVFYSLQLREWIKELQIVHCLNAKYISENLLRKCLWLQRRNQHEVDWGISMRLRTSTEELTHWKRPWCWERLRAGGKGDNRGWDGWMASPTRWTWVWMDSGSWWWTGRPGMLRFMGSQRVGHDWATELNWKQ